MILKTTLKKSKILCLLFILPLFLQSNEVKAQTRIYASSVSSEDEVDNSNLSHDSNLTTRARVRASSGVALGIGQYSGHLELQFPSTLPANTTCYVKIATDDNLLPFLLGGSLGTLLADVAGAVLIGNQEFTVRAKNNNSVVLTGNSQVASDFTGDRLRVITDPAGDYYLMITPNAAYNRIRLTNRVGALLGLGNVKNLDVYEAFYVSDPANCGNAAFTSFSGSGITLDLLQLGEAGVENPQNAIDASSTNYSTLSLGVLGVGSTVEQTIYFEGASDAADQFSLRIRLAQTLLDLNVANSISVICSSGGTVVQTQSVQTLLTLNLLSLQGGQITTIPISPGASIDRITVRFSSLVGASVTQNLDLFGVVRTPARPTITDPGTTNAVVCQGQSAALLATTPAGNELRWYNAATGGTLLQTVAAGNAFNTPALMANTTYYVASARIGCPDESSRVAVTVTVNITSPPTTTDTTQDFCGYTLPTLAGLQINQANPVFYSAASGGTALPSTTLLTDNTTYYVARVDGVTSCESLQRLAITVDLAPLCDVTLDLKVMLQGALFNSSGGLMRDNLRTQGLIPLNQPYSSSLSTRFTHVNGGGTETTTQAVLDANAGTGNAIVDWVFVEFRDEANTETVIRTVAALVQRDGNIVAANGGPLVVSLPGKFYVSVKHRNHFGALSSQLLTVANAAAALDFTALTDASLFFMPGFSGQAAAPTVGGVRALYAGNANYDIRVKYDGSANDRQVAASQVLSFPANTSQILNYANAVQYGSGDINMDGKVLYDGANNDRQLILNIVLTYPLNQNALSNFNGMLEQIPQ
jgi:hypothetical protein